jgi:hypothetical protein
VVVVQVAMVLVEALLLAALTQAVVVAVAVVYLYKQVRLAVAVS